MKVGDTVRHTEDGDIGLILSVDGICEGENPELYEILWAMDGYTPLAYNGFNGENLELANESR